MSTRGLALAACLALSACGAGDYDNPPPGTAVVTGTTVDAATGEPLAGVQVFGPGDVRATSDASGRFALVGLPEGQAGDLTARTEDGREATNPLRPLRNERLEVVLHLRKSPAQIPLDGTPGDS